MAGNQLAISNIINVSVAQTNLGANSYNTSNLGLFSDEIPASSFGAAGYKLYVDAPTVGVDFGTTSKTYGMALNVFSQQPNILAGNGQLVVMQMGVASQSWTFSGVAASGSFVVNWNGNVSTAINWNDSLPIIQSKIQAIPGLAGVTVTGTIVGELLTVVMSGVYGVTPAVFTFTSNTLETSGTSAITITNALSTVAVETWSFGAVAASGTFIAKWNGQTSAAINWNDSNTTIQTKLQAMTGLSSVTVAGSISSQLITITMTGVSGVVPPPFTFVSNSLATSGSVAIVVTNAIVASVGESIAAAITRTSSLVQYFGIMATETAVQIGSTDVTAAATVVQSLNKIAFWVSYLSTDIQSGGILFAFTTGSQSQNRGLYYGDNTLVNGYVGFNTLTYMAAYAGLGLSVNFSGSNTTTTMNLKSLINVQPDPTMSQTIYNEAAAAGADIYPSIQGDPGIISSGANKFFDQIYNLQWFVGAIQIAGYNYLAQTATKIPQTEQGMDGLKGAFTNVCNLGVTNQYMAPGTWTNPTTFGDQIKFFANISQFGYYVYSQPISQQLQTARAARQAPLVQIAVKEAGAIQSSSVLIYVNA